MASGRWITWVADWSAVAWDEVNFDHFDESSLDRAPLPIVALYYQRKSAYEQVAGAVVDRRQAEDHLRRVLRTGLTPWAFLPGKSLYSRYYLNPPDGFFDAYLALIKDLGFPLPSEAKHGDVRFNKALLDQWDSFFEEFFDWDLVDYKTIDWFGPLKEHPNHRRAFDDHNRYMRNLTTYQPKSTVVRSESLSQSRTVRPLPTLPTSDELGPLTFPEDD